MKNRRLLHGTGVVLLAVAGSSVLVFVLSAVTNMLTVFDRSPATFLPAEETLALLHHPSREDTTLIPELRDMEDVTAAALISTADGERVPVFFLLAESTPEDMPSIRLGAYTVRSPAEGVLEMLQQQNGNTLSEDTAYQQLSSEQERNGQWKFLRRQLVTLQDANLPQQLAEGLLFGNASALSLTSETGVISLTLYGGNATGRRGTSFSFPGKAGDMLTLNVQGGLEMFRNMQRSMSQENRTAFRGTLEHLLFKGFGELVSMEFDALPLLQEQFSASLSRNASGTLLVAIRGELEDSDALALSTDRLHRGIRLHLPRVKLNNYSFDNRFFTTNIRSDHTELEEELYMLGDWQVRSTMKKEASVGLFSALRNGEFVLANSEELLRTTLEYEPEVVAAQGTGRIFLPALLSLLREHLPAFTGEVEIPLLEFPSAILWTLNQRGPLTHITIQTE